MSNLKGSKRKVFKKQVQEQSVTTAKTEQLTQAPVVEAEQIIQTSEPQQPFKPVRCNYCGEYIFSSDDLVRYKAMMLHKDCFEKGYRNGSYEPETRYCESCGHEIAVTYTYLYNDYFFEHYRSLATRKTICHQCLIECATCGRKASADSLAFIDGKFYHPSCLVQCSKCEKYVPLESIEVVNGEPVCKECR